MRDSRLGRWAIMGPAVVLAALACGSDSDDDGGLSCGTFAACGGDPTGTWQSSVACVPRDIASAFPGLPPECDGAIVLEDVDSDTTLTVGADGTLTEQGSASLSWAMTFGPDCLAAAAGGVALDEVATRQICDTLQSDFAEDPTVDATVNASCSAAGTTCSCSVQRQTSLDTTITVSIEGSTLVYPGGIRQDFCVNGGQLDLGPAQGTGVDIMNAYNIYERVSP